MADIKWTELNPPERKRTYRYLGGEELVIENVARIEVRESGKHRIETVTGEKYFVAPGWLWIKIDVEAWTV